MNKMGICYGPVVSRRLGRSLGVNLCGDGLKVCSFDCGYCDLGPTELRLNRLKHDVAFPEPETIARELTATLRAIRDRSETIDAICVSGNGEPTLHPDFAGAIDAVLATRDLAWPGKPVVVLTNAANADSRSVRAALDRVDERMVKLDAGSERVFKALNGPLTRLGLSQIIANARALRDVTIQSLFVRGALENSGPADVEEWIEAVAMIRPKKVHILGLSRPPWNTGILSVDEDALDVIASKLERRTQIRAQVFR